MLAMVNPIDFGGHSSKVKVTMGIIDKCGVRGDATQTKRREGGPSPIRTPTNLLKIDKNRLLYCNRQ